MLFNSLEFLIFLPIVFLLYWFVFNRSLKLQNAFIVVVSYIFYGWWDKYFLILIALTSILSFSSGILIDKYRESYGKLINVTNIFVNLTILGVFKYYNFFADSFFAAMQSVGIEVGWVTLNLVLPVGISFYTFQALSYSIDVYNKKIDTSKDIIGFFAFVSFFPQLVAGPIERATNLLPQFSHNRKFVYDKAVDGCRQMLWGFFKKIVIADSCASVVNNVFSQYEDMPASSLWLGAIFFTVQIYCDFSGYSDIAIGTSRLFGFELKRNFNFPYFSRDIAEFWRRWHISLSTWFRDYVYIPLGGSREGNAKAIRNTFVIFALSGLWHGANWTFVVWGLYHALLFLPLMLIGKNRKNTNIVAEGHILPSIREVVQMGFTFISVVIGWVIFRATTIAEAVTYIGKMFSLSILKFPINCGLSDGVTIISCVFIVFLFLVEWLQRDKEHGLQIDSKDKIIFMPNVRFIRYAIYALVFFAIYLFMWGQSSEFIYFQF